MGRINFYVNSCADSVLNVPFLVTREAIGIPLIGYNVIEELVNRKVKTPPDPGRTTYCYNLFHPVSITQTAVKLQPL